VISKPEKILRLSSLAAIKKFIILYRAIFFILGLAGISIVGVLLLFNIEAGSNVDFITRTAINHTASAYRDLENNTINTLSATLESMMFNESVADMFYSRQGAHLLHVTRPIFERLRRENGITHWYFIDKEPENTCFLRVHNPGLRNDRITRYTLNQCIKTKQMSYGNELGKTALALRVVQPYYFKGQLIGYIEMAVETDHLFHLLKKQTGDEYGLLVNKAYLSEEKWASVMTVHGRRNNWADLDHLLLVDKTNASHKEQMFIEDLDQLAGLEAVPEKGLVLGMVSQDDKHFVRGIFPFHDAEGRNIGGIFILKDITDSYASFNTRKQVMAGLLIAFMGMVTFLMIFFHKRAENELRRYRNHLEEMVQEATAELRESNRKLNLEIDDHKRVQQALEAECKAREVAEKKQINAVKTAERSARLASIGVMAAGITHEINQPLNAIKVTADSIHYWHKRNPDTLPEPFVNQLSLISKSVKRIVEIIQHMRDFWVVPDTPAIERIDLNIAVKNALSLNRERLHSHYIQEKIELDSKPVLIEGNLIHFEQIIVNLVLNAVNALDESKRPHKILELKTYLDQEHKRAVLEIIDNGPGLPEEDIDKLADPFFSTHTGGEGMGLGLAIVKRYIDRYKGTIEAFNHREDAVVAGACFILKFPMADKKESPNTKSINDAADED